MKGATRKRSPQNPSITFPSQKKKKMQASLRLEISDNFGITNYNTLTIIFIHAGGRHRGGVSENYQVFDFRHVVLSSRRSVLEIPINKRSDLSLRDWESTGQTD